MIAESRAVSSRPLGIQEGFINAALVVSSKQIGFPAAAGPIGFPENRGKKAFFLVIEPYLPEGHPSEAMTFFLRRSLSGFGHRPAA
mgnify:CR=1 FL=1